MELHPTDNGGAIVLLSKQELEWFQQAVTDRSQYEEITGSVRRATSGDRACMSNAPNGYLRCEREKGHKGDHLAWTNYNTGRLYEGGRWENTSGSS